MVWLSWYVGICALIFYISQNAEIYCLLFIIPLQINGREKLFLPILCHRLIVCIQCVNDVLCTLLPLIFHSKVILHNGKVNCYCYHAATALVCLVWGWSHTLSVFSAGVYMSYHPPGSTHTLIFWFQSIFSNPTQMCLTDTLSLLLPGSCSLQLSCIMVYLKVFLGRSSSYLLSWTTLPTLITNCSRDTWLSLRLLFLCINHLVDVPCLRLLWCSIN